MVLKRILANPRALWSIFPRFALADSYISYVRDNVAPDGLVDVPWNYSQDDHITESHWGMEGIEVDIESQRMKVSRWAKEYEKIFRELRQNPLINVDLGPFIQNEFFETPAAEIYAAMIADFRPEKIIEIGAGYSTIIARTTVERLKIPCGIKVLDPHPRADIRDVADVIITERVENLNEDQLELAPNTILFIDSSHITKCGGDVPFLYNKVLPSAPPGILVHVHDICLPYDYPRVSKNAIFGLNLLPDFQTRKNRV